MMARLNNAQVTWLIAAVAAAFFIPFSGNCPLFDWDEVNFAECAREMVVTGDYSHVQMYFRPFWEKPPFFIWLQALSMNIFGANEFAARLPNGICSVITLVFLFRAGIRFHSREFGLMWCALYVSCMLPHLYFNSGLIDPWFNLLIMLAMYNMISLVNEPAGSAFRNALPAGIFLGLAVLTKGPAALVIATLSFLALIILHKDRRFLFSGSFGVLIASALLVSSSWFIMLWINGQGEIINEFVKYQWRLIRTGDAGHEGPFYYHVLVLLLGCFPASVIFLASYLKYRELTPYQRLVRRMMLCIFWVVLLLFSVVKTKIVHYSSLCYFPLTFIAAIGVVNYRDRLKPGVALRLLYMLLAVMVSAAFIMISFTSKIATFLIEKGWIRDEFVILNLQADAGWKGHEFIPGLIFLTGSLLVYISITGSRARLMYPGLGVLFASLYLAIIMIIPKVEIYTQHAAIEYYLYCADKNCYIETIGFKSYGYMFYSKRSPDDYVNEDQLTFINRQLDDMEKDGHSRFSSFPTANLVWMMMGKIDRPAYFISKTPQDKGLADTPKYNLLYRNNGYSLFVRYPERHAK